MTPEFAEALRQGANESTLRQVVADSGMKTILDDGLAKLSLTSLDEMIQEFPLPKIHDRQYEEPPAFKEKTVSTDIRHEWMIASIIKDRLIIDDMWEKYQLVKARDKETVHTNESELFRQYIETSFHHICRTYQCDSVTFRIESDKGRVELSATPGRP